jgi:hypothetical protein
MSRAARRKRRGLAGIVAAALMFAMLFSTGTAYFLYVNAQNQTYSQSLVNRANSLQNKMNEIFVATPVTTSSNTLGFTVQNTGNIPITIASVLLMDSSHNILGVYTATSQSQTNPALPYSVNTGITSPTIDTGYTYVNGNTYLMEIITQRGTSQTVSYPPNLPNYVKQAQASGSLTVDMSTFRWVQIGQGASLLQNNYQNGCSGNTCSLGYQNQVIGADTLVYGLGWYGATAPTLSDTLGDSFTLDVSNSVAAVGNPNLLQSAWSSSNNNNCGGSPPSCTQPFSNAVAQGDVLLVTVGWYSTGTSSVSTVTDSLSTSFTASSTAKCTSSSGTCGTGTDYYTNIYYGTAPGSGSDTVTVKFSTSVSGVTLSVYELDSATTTGFLYTSGSGTSGTSLSVTSFKPSSGEFIVGAVETGTNYYTQGSGFTLVDQHCNQWSNNNGCSEYGAASGSSTTVPMTGHTSSPWVEVAVAIPAGSLTYYSYIWHTQAVSTGSDTITATFSNNPQGGSISIYELQFYTTTGLKTSIGSSSTGSSTSSVTSFTPTSNSIVIGNTETASSSSDFSAGSGYTLDSGGRYGNSCTSNVNGCSEYATGMSSATTAPTSLGQSVPWVEAAVAFPALGNPQTGALVGGYPAVAVPGSCQQYWYQCPNPPNIVFQITFTNEDPKGRSVILYPPSSMSVDTMIYSGGSDDNFVTSFYIVDGLNSAQYPTGVTAYNSTHDFIVLPVNVPVTIYFGANTPLSSNMQTVSNADLAPFEALFTLTGIYSDNTLYGQTIPFPSGIVTGSLVTLSSTAGLTNTVISVTTPNCSYNGGCFIPNRAGYIGWMSSTGAITVLTKFTTDSNGNINTSFTVPSAPAGYYTVIISDYVNSVFFTFTHQ